ncbi:coenzyme F390 synthetase [Haladaptatus sp. T7]|nr:coenzyme F390 synthetase [Haladaptatus sp. T7]
MNQPSSLAKLRTGFDAFRMKNASEAEIRERQQRRLQELLDFVLRNSRFYKRLYDDIDRPITTLDSLPPVTKSQLMEHFDSVVTDTAVELDDVADFTGATATLGERFLGRYPVWMTSGTTGEPGIFLQDDWSKTATDAVRVRWALSALFDLQTIKRLIRHKGKIAEIAVGGGHFAGASGVEIFRKEHRRLQDRIRLVSPDQPLSEVIAELNEYQPAVLIGYATVLLELERKQRSGQLKLSPAYIAPTGEPITSEEKDRLRTTFGASVREIYGATEFYGIGVECERGNVHVNTDWVILEPVDADYQPVDPGEPSETVLVTNLANRIQPLVRYDLGDSVTMYEERCPCGSAFPVIEVEGRQGEVLHFETDEGNEIPIFPLALTSVVEETPGVRRSQIVKTGSKRLRIRLEFEEKFDEESVWKTVENELSDFFATQGVGDISIEQATEAPARDSQSGKFRHVWSEA